MIRIETLGRTRVFVQGRELTTLLRQPIRCGLLLYLAVERKVTRDKLINVFWSDGDDADGRHALNQNVHELRKLLGPEAIVTKGNELHIEPSVQVDLHVFNEAVERSDLRVALEVYQGSFLQSGPNINSRPFEEWIDQRALKSLRAWVRASRTFADELVASGNIDAAIQVARRVTELQPQEDELQHQLIQMLADAGRRSEALAQYEIYERALRDDDLSPLDETVELIARLKSPAPGERDVAMRPGRQRDAAVVRDLEPAVVQDATEQTRSDSADRGLPPRPPVWAHRAWQMAALLVLVIVSSITYVLITASGPEPVRIAIFSPETAGSSAQLNDIATTLAEDLSSRLANLPGAVVLPRVAALPAGSSANMVDSIARQLRAEFFISSVLTLGNGELQARFQLVNVQSGAVMGSAKATVPWPPDNVTYAQLVNDGEVFARTELSMELRMRRYRAETRNAEAWRLYMRADSFMLNANETFFGGSRQGAIRQLVEADSMLALAEELDASWIRPALLRVSIAQRRAGIEEFLTRGNVKAPTVSAWYDSAVAHASRALVKKPDNVEVLEARGSMQYRLWEFLAVNGEPHDSIAKAAMDDLEKAVARDQSRARAWIYLARIHHASADFRTEASALSQALQSDLEARERDESLYRLAVAQLESGLESEAREHCLEGRRLYPLEPKFLFCEMTLLAFGPSTTPDTVRAGRIVSEITTWPRPIQNWPNHFRMMSASVFMRAGRPDRANAIISQVRDSTDLPGVLKLEAAARVLNNEHQAAISLLRVYAPAFPAEAPADLRARIFKPLTAYPDFNELLKTNPPVRVDR